LIARRQNPCPSEKFVGQRRTEKDWSYGESPYFCYGEEYFGEVSRLFDERPDHNVGIDQWLEECDLRVRCMEEVMKRLDKKDIFGEGEKRKSILINVEVMPPDYRNTERALRLNPRGSAILAAWLDTDAERLPDRMVPRDKTEFTVVLQAVGDNKVEVMKELRTLMRLVLKEAKDLVEGAPKNLMQCVAKDEAEKIKATLEKMGAKVELKASSPA